MLEIAGSIRVEGIGLVGKSTSLQHGEILCDPSARLKPINTALGYQGHSRCIRSPIPESICSLIPTPELSPDAYELERLSKGASIDASLCYIPLGGSCKEAFGSGIHTAFLNIASKISWTITSTLVG